MFPGLKTDFFQINFEEISPLDLIKVTTLPENI